MLGIEIAELFSLGRQFGFALSGAAALWGFIFLWRAKKTGSVLLSELGHLLLPLFSLGFVIALVSWALLGLRYGALAHEGIVLIPTADGITAALELLRSLYFLWAMIGIAGLLLFMLRPYRQRLIGHFYLAMFALSFVLISFPVWTGSWSNAQFFFAGHSFHSIFTVGTVLVLDTLMLLALLRPGLTKTLYPLFPTISKVIWVGLGFDFISVALVFPEALALTPKFFFMQTVIGILIINGVILSGPLTRKLTAAGTMENMSASWRRAAPVCGAVSAASWLTITIVDAFHALTLGYGTLLALYLVFIGTLYTVHRLSDYAIHTRKKVGAH